MNMLQRLAEVERGGEPVALATIIQSRGSVPRRAGSKMLIYADRGIEGTIGGGTMEQRVIDQAEACLQDGQIRMVHYNFNDPALGDPGICGGEIDVSIEPFLPPPTLVIVGAGHVGKAVAHLAKWLHFRVVVSDDRPEFCNPENVPDADDYLVCALQDLPAKMKINRFTYLVLTTRGSPVDVAGLPAILETNPAFIGVIGSRRRWELTAAEMQNNGVPREKIERVTSPIGLELNAETPEEIAVSILAQIMMLRGTASGESMAHTPKMRKANTGG